MHARSCSLQQPRPLTSALVTAVLTPALWGSAHAVAAGPDESASINTLKSMSIEQLLDIEVTSVSRRPEKLLDAPAAVQVITGEDIRRFGASSIPQALQLSSNLDVARKDAHQWVISARGFSSDVGNKMLVLFDGRSVYTPLFSGVFWDRQDYVLEDIDRIEIIRGPGGALWGANAVNGVINITTLSAHDTQGLYLEGGGGSSPESFASARYGGLLTENTAYRVYGKYSRWGSNVFADGSDAGDDWHAAQGGFRFDALASARDSLTVQGDFYRNDEGITTGGEAVASGGNVLGRWSRTFSDRSDMTLQVYYDGTHLRLPVPAVALAPAGIFKDDLDTYDVDFQHRFAWGDRHVFVWGLGYRHTHDEVSNAPGLAFFPTDLDQDLFSAFVQDEIALRPELVLTLGSKVEHNDYTGFEYEPSVRLQWNVTDRQTLWGAVSRAVRAPSRIDRDFSQPSPEWFIVLLKGGPNFRSETLVAYELGYRGQLGPEVGGSLSLFYNDYDHLRSTTTSPPDPLFHLPFPFFFENNLEGETYGFELSAALQPLERWNLRASYRLLEEDIRVKPGRTDFNNGLNETSDPEQQFSLRTSVELRADVDLAAALRWVDKRRINNAGVPETVPDYVELNLRIGWQPTPSLELSVNGENLLHDHHAEYGVPGPTRVEIERTVYGKVVWRY